MKDYTEFEYRIADIYRDLGAKVETDKLIGGLQVDVFSIQTTPDGCRIRTAIECKYLNKPLGVRIAMEECNKLNSLLNLGLIDKPLIVTNIGYTHDARLHCESQNVECFTEKDLDSRRIDFSQYLVEVTNCYEKLDVFKKNLFIPLGAKDEEDEDVSSIIDFVKTWADGPQKVLLMLGEYGAGKTTTLFHVGHIFANSTHATSERKRLPIVIELKDFGHSFNIRSYLQDYLITQKRLIRDYSLFEKLNAQGRFLLLFDAFDEMSINVDPGLLLRNFNEILSLAKDNAKIIITCRSNFFKDMDELRRVQKGNQFEALKQAKFSSRTVFLKEFSREQIHDYLSRYYGHRWTECLTSIEKSRAINILANRPITLNMIVSTHKEPASFRFLRETELYERYTSIWLDRDNWRCTLPYEIRTRIIEALAFETITKNKSSIHHSELTSKLPEYLGFQVDHRTLEQYGHEVRVYTFLKNDLHGNYKFTHRSFAEFFAAKYIARKILEDDISILASDVSIETVNFFCDMISSDRQAFVVRMTGYLKTEETSELSKRIKAVVLYCLHRIGGNTIDVDLSYINISEGMGFKDASFSNLKMKDIQGNKVDFSGADFSHSDLSNASLENCCFRKANLYKTNLTGANLEGSVFTKANLSEAIFENAILKDITLSFQDIVSFETGQARASISVSLEKLLSTIENPVKKTEYKSENLLKALGYNDKKLPEEIKKVINRNNSQSNVNAKYLDLLKSFSDNLNQYIRDLGKLYLKLQGKHNNTIEKFNVDLDKLYKPVIVQKKSTNKDLVETKPKLRLPKSNYKKASDIEKQIREERFKFKKIKLRYELLHMELNEANIMIIEFLKKLHAMKSNEPSMVPDVSGALFANSKELTASQSGWASKNGAVMRIE